MQKQCCEKMRRALYKLCAGKKMAMAVKVCGTCGAVVEARNDAVIEAARARRFANEVRK